MKHYGEKYNWLYEFQHGICTGCGKTLSFVDYDSKNDLSHNLPKTKVNIKNYPLFIHSLPNLSLQHNGCNVARKQPKYDTGGKLSLLINDYLYKHGNSFIEVTLDNSLNKYNILELYYTNYKNGFFYTQAEVIEKWLNENKMFAKYVNMGL